MKEKNNYEEKLLSIIESNASNEKIMEAYKIALKEAYRKLALYAKFLKLASIFFIVFLLVMIDFIITYTTGVSTYPILTNTLNYLVIVPSKFIWNYILLPTVTFSWNYILLPTVTFSWNYILKPIGIFCYYDVIPNIIPMTKSFFIFFWNYIIVAPTVFVWNYIIVAPTVFVWNYIIVAPIVFVWNYIIVAPIVFFWNYIIVAPIVFFWNHLLICLTIFCTTVGVGRYILAKLLDSPNQDNSFPQMEIGSSPDKETLNNKITLSVLEEESNQGNPFFQMEMGNKYYDAKDFQMAYYWYEKVANQGYEEAKQKLQELNELMQKENNSIN